ncbi:MAG: AbrB/MazE/SpoVT family DNA-binding domain-containing protein [Nitrosopumilus sp.]|nr:AbrB/MazE/SpoVT family DNA-binding domain-containing protein [Nitrosopumilus sp.]
MKDIHTKLGEGGRVIIPTAFRIALHLKPGDDIILYFANNEIYMTTPTQSLLKLQSKVKKYMDQADKPISLVDELLTMRQNEFKNEQGCT